MKCNRTKIAEIFGVNLTTVDNWKRNGCPFEKEGHNVVFKTENVINWRVDKLRRERSNVI